MDLIQALLAHGANVNAQLKKQQPYRTKLDRGADTMLGTGTTPMLRAAKAGDAEVDPGAARQRRRSEASTKFGMTPLMAAAGLGTKEEDTTGAQEDRGGGHRVHQALSGRRSGRERGRQSRRHGAAWRGAKGLGSGGAIPGGSWRQAGRQRQKRPHAAGCRQWA